MAGFSSQHYPFLLDSAFQPNTTTTITAMPSLLEGEIYASATPTEIAFPTPTHESSCFGNDRKVDSCNKTSVMKTEKPESPTSMVSTLLEKGEMDGFCFSYCSPDVSPEIVVTAAMHAINCDKNNGNGDDSFVIEMEKEVTHRFERKRKNRDGCCLVNAQPKEGKGEKQKNRSCSSMKGKEKKPKAEKKETGIFEEPSTGYIHVRARRGQATDRHSLAERARREKISERMKLLQGLVPSCDKVTGKAQILDEIINYVQSLQNQVEFLSIKLASVAPMFFNLGPDLDDYRPEQEEIRSFPSTFPPIQQSIHNQATSFAVTTTTSKTFPTINYPIMEHADTILHSPSDFSQDTCNLAWDVKDQGPNIFSKAGYDNTASFQ